MWIDSKALTAKQQFRDLQQNWAILVMILV